MSERPAIQARRGPAHFTQRDLTVTLKAMKAAGTAIEEIKIDSAGITIIPSRESDAPPRKRNSWDEDE